MSTMIDAKRVASSHGPAALAAALLFAATFAVWAESSPAGPSAAQAETLAETETRVARDYPSVFGGLTDLTSVSSLGVNLYAVLSDLSTYGITPNLPKGFAPVFDMAWQTWWSFMLTIWPHEFGHWMRAREIGGEFVFVEFGIPWPDARVELPADADLFLETLTSTGGFEINSLMRLQILEDLYANGAMGSSLLVHSFIQGIYYPAYAWLVAPMVNGGWIDPENADTWINTMGDPVESAFLVYRNHTGNGIPAAGGTVDETLVSYYRECLLMSLLWTVIDPGLYQGLGLIKAAPDSPASAAQGLSRSAEQTVVRPFMFGGKDFSWIYGTLFTATPLGYELSLLNHFRVRGTYALLTLRYGRPFVNFGAGVSIPYIVATSAVRIGARADWWYQEPFGHGAAFRIVSDFGFGFPVRLRLAAGWKSEGFLLGMPVDQALYLQGGVVIPVEYTQRR